MFSLAGISAHLEFVLDLFGENSREFVLHRLPGIIHGPLKVIPEGIYHSIWICFIEFLNSVFYLRGCELLAFFFFRSTPSIQVSARNGDTQQMFNSCCNIALL